MRESTTTDTAITHCTLLQFDGRLPYDLPHQPNQWSDSDAVQLDRPGPGAVAGADGVQHIGAAMVSWGEEGGNPALGFLVLLIPGCVISYGATIFLLLPSLFLLSLWRPVTAFMACLVGLHSCSCH